MECKIKIEKGKHLELFTLMNRIRMFEQIAEELFLHGEVPGFLHSSIGQEASAVGVCAAIGNDDYMATTHRGHGHVVAKGGDVNRMMAELYGKVTGYCRGKGGSMHISCRELGILGANGIVAGGIPITTGAALSAKMRGTDQVAVSFFGDGASDEGAFHESLNIASIYKLPVLFVCENNHYAESNPQAKHQNIKDVAVRAKAYNIDSVIADGTDIMDVYQKTLTAVEQLRKGNGPILMENKCYRWSGHYVGDPAVYRPKEEPLEWKTNRDPIKLYAGFLRDNKIADSKELEAIAEQETKRIWDAVEFARNSDDPDLTVALEDVYA